MTPLPSPLGGAELVAWRLDSKKRAGEWDSGEGARRGGGLWNSKGVRAVYCSIDPATAILEVAVHKSFEVLDTVPHVLTALIIANPHGVHIVELVDVRDPGWLRIGPPTREQQAWGDELLQQHKVFVIPSAVSRRSWNLVFDPVGGAVSYGLKLQEAFELDPRLHPAS